MIGENIEVRMPDFSQITTDTAYISEWFVKVGDEVKEGDFIVEFETSRASFEFPSETEGVVLHLAKNVKDLVNFDELLCVIGMKKVGNVSINNEGVQNLSSKHFDRMIVEMTIPPIGESVKLVEITDLKVQNGAKVKAGEIIAEFESDKASFEMPADANGIIYLHENVGSKLRIGEKIATIVPDGIEYIPKKTIQHESGYINQENNKKSGFLNRLWDFLTPED